MTRGPLPSGVLADYVFDARNHLKSAGGESYSYDAEGNRVSLTNAAGTTRFVIDPNGGPMSRVLVRERPDTTKVLHVYAGSLLLYEVEAATDTPRYFHSDHVGNTVALSNAAGAITDRITYTPFGSITSRTGTSDTPFLFGGALGCATSSNGLVHMRARYYQPKLGRFINQDPIGFEGGTNWYGYCDNDPISNTDPSGLYFGLDDAVAAGAGSVIGLAVQGGMDLYHGKMSPGSHYLAAAAGGAIAGAGTLYIGPGGLGLGTAAAAGISGAAGGAYANTIRQSADISSGRQDSFSGTSLALETGLGGAGSVIGAKVLPAVLGGLSNATKGSIGETTSLITNLARGNVPLGGEGIGRLAGAYTWWRKNSAMGLAI